MRRIFLELRKNQKGDAFLILVIVMCLIFPLLVTSTTQFNSIFKISGRMKLSLNTAVKSASGTINWDKVPSGVVEIDAVKAEQIFVDIFKQNMSAQSVTPLGPTGAYVFKSPDKGEIRVFVKIYNGRHHNSFVSIPAAGEIPSVVTSKSVYGQADRPSVYAVASYTWNMPKFMGGKKMELINMSISQLNTKTQVTNQLSLEDEQTRSVIKVLD